jgi:hypothetical protein
MGIYETQSSEFTVDQDGIRVIYYDGVIDDYHQSNPPVSTSTVHLCYWCRQFESKEDRDEDTYEEFNYLINSVLEDIGVPSSVYTGIL